MKVKPQKGKANTPSFVCEIPLRVSPSEEVELLTRLDAGRQLYNACLGEALARMRLSKQSKAYQIASSLNKDDLLRKQLFKQARVTYQYSEYALPSYATFIRHSWIGNHIDANTAQKLASRAFKAVERVMYGQAKKVRLKGKSQMDSLEGKTNKQGIRWKDNKVLWSGLEISAIIEDYDTVIQHGLSSPIKYVRIVRRKRSGRNYFYAQLVCEGKPFRKPKNTMGTGIVGLDIGSSTIAIVGDKTARLLLFCAEIIFSEKKIRRLQRLFNRQRRANNPENYNENGTVNKGKKTWKKSNCQKKTERQLANIQRREAAHRKTLHGRLVNEIIQLGDRFQLEKLSYKVWQKIFGKSIGYRAPGGFVAHLRRTAESAGGLVYEFSTRTTALSQTCHCGRRKAKRLSERVHRCECGVTAQRDLYSSYLARFVIGGETDLLQAKQALEAWWGAEQLLRTAWQAALKTNQRVRGALPASFGFLPESELIVPEGKSVAIDSQNVVAKWRESGKGSN